MAAVAANVAAAESVRAPTAAADAASSGNSNTAAVFGVLKLANQLAEYWQENAQAPGIRDSIEGTRQALAAELVRLMSR